MAPDGPSTFRTTDLVTPRIVRLPVTFILPAETRSIFVDLKVMAGWLATSRKLALLRSASRLGSPVSTVLASMVTSTSDLVRSWSSQLTVPVTPLNCPRTVAIIMCLTENPAAVCAGSICQVVVAAGDGTAKDAASVAAREDFASNWPILLFLSNLKCIIRRILWMRVTRLLVFAGLLPARLQGFSSGQQQYCGTVFGVILPPERQAFAEFPGPP